MNNRPPRYISAAFMRRNYYADIEKAEATEIVREICRNTRQGTSSGLVAMRGFGYGGAHSPRIKDGHPFTVVKRDDTHHSWTEEPKSNPAVEKTARRSQRKVEPKNNEERNKVLAVLRCDIKGLWFIGKRGDLYGAFKVSGDQGTFDQELRECKRSFNNKAETIRVLKDCDWSVDMTIGQAYAIGSESCEDVSFVSSADRP